MRRAIVFLGIVLMSILACQSVQAAVIYVDASVTGGDGSSWSTAYSDLQAAIDAANSGDAVWVKAGTYYPTETHGLYGQTGSRYRSFQMKYGVKIYGGFEGNEASDYDLADRDLSANETILSGDIDGDGVLNSGNSYQVVCNAESLGLDSTAVLDGVTVTMGYADDYFNFVGYGGGMSTFGTPTISNCTFRGNYSQRGGGGIACFRSLTISNCTFTGNTASAGGGGIYIQNGTPTISNCIFTGNTGGSGGAIHILGSSPSFTNCTFSGNAANYRGGAIYNSTNGTPVLSNCILWDNTAWSSGDEIDYSDTSNVGTISYSNIEGSGGSGDAWDTSLGTDGGNNLDSDPLFIGSTDLHLTENSPCIDAGSDTAASGISGDMDGETRFSGTVDMGADEFVDTDGDGLSDYGEEELYGTDPGNGSDADVDSDGDGISNRDEVDIYGTDPTTADADADTDGDGATNRDEVDIYGTDPTTYDRYVDTDGDGATNRNEVDIYHTNPTLADTDADTDGDGVSNREEVDTYGTDPITADEDADTDGDGISNRNEVDTYGTDPTTADVDADTDGDGITNRQEVDTYGTDPEDADTDDDGYADGAELGRDSDPLDSGSIPVALILYVDGGATGANDGSSWADAFSELEDALDFACMNDAIWVAAGTYYPTEEHGGEGEMCRSFQMKKGVAIYGGFAGDETAISDRDPSVNVTVLSGDIGVAGDDSDNCYHVFYHTATLLLDETAVLDGFTITGGGSFVGGGMYNYESSPTLKDCIFTHNSGYYGGGMFNYDSSPTLMGCTFTDNTAYYGGGMYNDESSPTLTDCTFAGNAGTSEGGGVYEYGTSSTFKGCIFSGNTADSYGGGMYSYNGSQVLVNSTFTDNAAGSGGGVYVDDTSSTIEGCLFSGNTAEDDGGGIYNYGDSETIALANCTFTGNTAGNGGGMYNDYGTVTLVNSLLWGNTATDSGDEMLNDGSTTTVSYSDIQGSGGSGDAWDTDLGTDGGGNMDSDPLFVSDTDFHLTVSSPCIDAGSDDGASGMDEDMDGETRIVGTVDMGADEFLDTDGDGTVDRLDDDDDGDGMSDEDELNLYGTDPTIADADADTDGDGMTNKDEVDIYGTNPTTADADADTDGDGVTNKNEVAIYGTDPNNADSDGDGVLDGTEIGNGMDPLTAEGPGVPVLVSPETDAGDVLLSPELEVAYADDAWADTHQSTRWQIGADAAFSEIIADISSEAHLLGLTVPDLVLDAETTYHWRVRFTGTDGLARAWSDTGRFTTAADDRGDEDGDGIPDDQQLSGDESGIDVESETDWQDGLTAVSFETEAGDTVQAALRLSDDGSSLTFFKQTADIPDDAPAELDLGLFSFRITVPAAGGSTKVRLYYSTAILTEESTIYKYDTVTGWYDYSAYTTLSDNFSFLTVELVDGGYGDADGVANGVIVDPLGTSTPTDDAVDTESAAGGGGGGCFIGSLPGGW